MAVHFIRSAMATVLLSQRRTSPASETKPGKAPKDVEYVGGSFTQNDDSRLPGIQPWQLHTVHILAVNLWELLLV